MSEPPAPTPLRLFLDTNTLVSALVHTGRERELLFLAGEGRCVAVVTQFVIAETVRVLTTKFARTRAQVEHAMARVPFEMRGEPASRLLVQARALLRDPDDAPILAAAWDAGVDALVTGDKDFLEAEHDLRLRVLRTSEALDLLRGGAGSLRDKE